jgi:hypothetical protein
MPLLFRSLDDETMAAHAWSENRDRSDLSAWEEAKAIEKRMQVFGWSQTEAAKRMGMDRSTISNKLRLLKLPPAQQQELHAGELSERQALALLPLLDLNSEVSRGDAWGSPTAIIAKAKERSSDDIRRDVGSCIAKHSNSLANIPFTDVDIDGDVICSRCTVCPVRMKYENQWRCTNQHCYDSKWTWWIEQALGSARAASGLNLVIGGDFQGLAYGSYEDFYINREQFQEILAGGCPKGNLRLFYKRDPHGARYNTIDGYSHAIIVCAHGAHRRCTCLAAKKAVLDKQRKEIERHRTERADAILAPAKAAILAGLRTRNLLIWRMLTDHLFYDADARTKIAKITTVEDLEAIIVDKLLSGMPGISSYAAIDPDLAREAATAILKMLPDVCTQTPDPEPDVCTQTPEDSDDDDDPRTTQDVLDFHTMGDRARAHGMSLRWDQGTWNYTLSGKSYPNLDAVRVALDHMADHPKPDLSLIRQMKQRVREQAGTWHGYDPSTGKFHVGFNGIPAENYTVTELERQLIGLECAV